MKILCTVGQEKFQFNSFINKVNQLNILFPQHQFIVQYGNCTLLPTADIKQFSVLSQDEFSLLLDSVDCVISHCGEGNFLLLQEKQIPYILVPRKYDLKEHIDNHQLELAEFLQSKNIPIAYTLDHLESFLNNPSFIPFHTNLDDVSNILTVKYKEVFSIMNICSTGGHYHGIKLLNSFYQDKDVVWVTFPNSTTKLELNHQKVQWAYFPTNRNIFNLIRNLFLAPFTITKYKPQLILSTGAGISVPFLWIGKLFGCNTVFVESITRVNELSLSARILMKVKAIDTLVVRSPKLKLKYPSSLLAS